MQVGWPVVPAARGGQPPAQVRTIQYLLDARGYPVTPTGTWGTQTEAAVRAFQRARGLAVTGVVTAPTWQLLIETVKLGIVGDAVKAAQNMRNYYNLKGTGLLAVDGIFGPLTDNQIRGFQAARGLVVDGIVGPITWRYLVSLYEGG
jgi:peptidoglycan hydrolase-like protein with peptidoglycan-binding domain